MSVRAEPSSPPSGARDLRARWNALNRSTRILAVLFAATCVMKAITYLGIAGGPLVGDEAFYLDSARALSNLIRDVAWLQAPDTAELERHVVGSGWFMPGMSVVLTPLYLVVPGASLALVRAYLSVFSTILLLLTVLKVRRTLGDLPAGAMLVFPGLVPTYAVFGAAAWGDTSAGLLVVLMLCQAVDMLRAARDHGTISWRDGVKLGIYAIVAVYFRSSVSLLVVGMLGLTFVLSLVLARRADRLRVVGTYVAAGVVFVGLLAPWSIGASASLNGPVLTTVSVPTVRANAFGDRDTVCFGECDPGTSIWFSPLRYSREQGRATGLSELAIADEMSAYARRHVTAQSYARDVGINSARYFGTPARFATLLRWDGAPYNIVPLAEVLTLGTFYPACLVMLVLLGAATRRRFDTQLTLVLLKVGIIGLLAQPFVHIGGPRYWTTMAPMLGIGAALLWTLRQERRAELPVQRGAVSTTLFALQIALGVFALAIVATIGLLAI